MVLEADHYEVFYAIRHLQGRSGWCDRCALDQRRVICDGGRVRGVCRCPSGRRLESGSTS